jgi:hypothetical protein
MGHADSLQPGVRGRKSILVLLPAPEEPILGHGVMRRLLDGVREQDEADVIMIPSRVTTGLVIGLHAGETEPVDGRGGLALNLEDPQPEPSRCAIRLATV